MKDDIANSETTTAGSSPRRIEREDLYRIKLVGDVDISSDGQRIAYVVKSLDREKDDYVGNIHVWEKGSTRQYTRGGKDSSPRWSPDGRWLAFLSGRDEKSQIYVLPTEGGEARALTKLELGVGEPIWSPDSTRIAFAAPTSFPSGSDKNVEDPPREARTKIIDRAIYKLDGSGFNQDRRTHIFVVDLQGGEARQLTEGDSVDRSPAWAPDGHHLAFASNRDPDWDTERRSDIWTIAVEGGAPRKLTEVRGMWAEPSFSPDGRLIAFSGFLAPEGEDPDFFPQLWMADRRGRRHTNLLDESDLAEGRSIAGDWAMGEGTSPRWEGDGIYFLTTTDGSSRLLRWTEDGIVDVATGDQDVMSFSVAATGQVAYAKSDATHPAEIFLCRHGKEIRITRENDAWLAEVELQAPERLTVTGADEAEVEGWLLKPSPAHANRSKNGQTYPLLLYIHGGPQSAYGHTFFHELQWWAAQGYAVAYCNPHGSAGRGRAFQQSIRHDWGNKDYQDVMAFVDAVAALDWIDSNRMAAAGGSYGGYMVNWLAGHTDRFSAFCTQRSICNVVSLGGTSDFAAFRQDRSGGTPENNPDLLWRQSPLKYAANARTPTLIIHQELDHRCPIEQGEQWFSALKRMRVPARFIRFPQESHGLSRNGKPSRRFERLGHMKEWFDRYV